MLLLLFNEPATPPEPIFELPGYALTSSNPSFTVTECAEAFAVTSSSPAFVVTSYAGAFVVTSSAPSFVLGGGVVPLQTIQAGNGGTTIPFTCQQANLDGSISPIDFTSATGVTITVTSPTGTTSPNSATIVDASAGELSFTTTSSTFPSAGTYTMQVTATLASGADYVSPRASILVLG